MAKMQVVLPDDLINDLNKVYNNTDKILGAMTKAGAETVQKNAKASVPISQMANHVKVTKPYKTLSDGGINTKVYFSGYLPFKGNRTSFVRSGGSGKKYIERKGIPVDFIANIFEYGRSGATFPKKPFFRKAFKKSEIERAMLKAQKEASGGIIDE